MEISLKAEEKIVSEAQEKTEKMLTQLGKDEKEANTKKEEVEATTAMCEEQERTISQQKADAEKDLAAAMPALEAAKSAVNALQPADVVEVKNFKNKIPVVSYVMDTVCIFKGEKL